MMLGMLAPVAVTLLRPLPHPRDRTRGVARNVTTTDAAAEASPQP